MNRGCIISAVVVVLVVAIAGYYAYDRLKDVLSTPKDLLPYARLDSMQTRLDSHAPAPSPGTRLTAEHIRIFIGALDSVNVGWKEMERGFDSINLRKGVKDSGKIDLWASPFFLQQFMRMPLTARRALVAYLNANHASWEEYLWIKEHVIAASGITKEDVDSVFTVRIHEYFSTADTARTSVSRDSMKVFFARVDALRAGGGVDSADMELAAPYRTAILDRGLLALLGLETNFRTGLDLKIDSDSLDLSLKSRRYGPPIAVAGLAP
jgi:hypothetical protein